MCCTCWAPRSRPSRCSGWPGPCAWPSMTSSPASTRCGAGRLNAARPAPRGRLARVRAVAALAVVPQLERGSMLPSLQDRNLLLRVTAAPGTSLPEMDRITTAAENRLRTLPGVQGVGTHVGRAVGSDQLVDVN